MPYLNIRFLLFPLIFLNRFRHILEYLFTFSIVYLLFKHTAKGITAKATVLVALNFIDYAACNLVFSDLFLRCIT